MNFMTFHILGIIIPTDELIFFRGIETTNQSLIDCFGAWFVNHFDVVLFGIV